MKALILSSICSLIAVSFLSPNLSDNQVIFFTVVVWVTFLVLFWIWSPKIRPTNIRIEHKPKAAPQKQRKVEHGDDSMKSQNDASVTLQIAQYRRWCVQVIGNTIITEKLNVGLARTVTGALT